MTDRTTLNDIAAALGISRQAASKRASRESWPYQEEARGGTPTKVYPLATLPKPIAQQVFIHLAAHQPVTPLPAAIPAPALPAVVATPSATTGLSITTVDPASLDEAQRIKRDARVAIREFVDTYPGSIKAALTHLNVAHERGMLTHHLAWACEHCHDKKRAGQRLALKTYHNWQAIEKARGTLAPAKKQKDHRVQPWHAVAVALRQRPQGSTMTWIHEQLAASGYVVSYHQVARFFRDQFSSLDQLKGRYTGSQLRTHRFYQHRTAEGLAPADEVHADGWNTHFSAPHPATGEFVTYEVWHFHDIATRFVTPPGLGLTEQFEVIAKGLENFIRYFGRPLIVQTDSTKIVRGSERFTRGLHSLEERIGCTIVHPKEVGNSQANGVCENFNTTWLDKKSHELATYQHPDKMDSLSFKRIKKLTGAMVKAGQAGDMELAAKKHAEAERMGKGRVFTSHQEAIDWIVATVDAYNDRPHRSLKRVRGEDGKLRHQTPREALMEHIGNGWEPVEVDEHTLVDLFRPHRVCKVSRETVSPYGGMRYRNPEVLGHWNGKEVVVAYDIHDWRQVWIKTLQGELICIAEFVAATGYRAKTAYEVAEEKRAKAQVRSLDNKKKAVEAQRMGGQVIELPSDGLIPARDVIDMAIPTRTEPLRDVREVLAELAPADSETAAPAREMSWEETKMWLYGGGKDLREEEQPPEEAAAR